MALNTLVVDDSSVMRSIIIKTLKLSGLPLGEIWEAKNGEEGLRILQDKWIDLALVDIHMPVMNGVEAVKAIKAVKPEIKILILSTYDEDEYVRLALSNGASGFSSAA